MFKSVVAPDLRRPVACTSSASRRSAVHPHRAVRAKCASQSGGSIGDGDYGIPSHSQQEPDTATMAPEDSAVSSSWMQENFSSSGSIASSVTIACGPTSEHDNSVPLITLSSLAAEFGWDLPSMPPMLPDSTNSGVGSDDITSNSLRITLSTIAAEFGWDLLSAPTISPDTPLPSVFPHGDDAAYIFPGSRKDIWTLTDQPGIDLLAAGSDIYCHVAKAFVILFGDGKPNAPEGVYSLRAFLEEGSPQETIIVFQSREDAQRYAALLEATMDHAPKVCTRSVHEMLSFSREHGYRCRFQPAGSLLIPPDCNVRDTNWERSRRLREGQFNVLDSEPDRRSDLGTSSSTLAQLAPQSSTHWPDNPTPARYLEFTAEVVEMICDRLEDLLPPS